MVKRPDYRVRAADYRVGAASGEPGNVFLFENKPLTGFAGFTAPFSFARLAGPRCPEEDASGPFCLRALDPVIPVNPVKCKRDRGKAITGSNRDYRVRVPLGSLPAARVAPDHALCAAEKGASDGR